MRHITRVTVAKASTEKIDEAGSVFLQIWAAVVMTMLMGAFGMKN